jgi:hypothetical protein
MLRNLQHLLPLEKNSRAYDRLPAALRWAFLLLSSRGWDATYLLLLLLWTVLAPLHLQASLRTSTGASVVTASHLAAVMAAMAAVALVPAVGWALLKAVAAGPLHICSVQKVVCLTCAPTV